MNSAAQDNFDGEGFDQASMFAGGIYARDNWRQMARSKLVLLARRRPDLLDAGFTSLDVQMADDGTDSVMAAADMNANSLSHEQQNRQNPFPPASFAYALYL